MRNLFALLIGLTMLVAGNSYAGENWQQTGRPHVCDMPSGPRLEKCYAWISTVQRPDIRGASCCGDGDAYIADNFEVVDGELFAIITADYAADDPNGAHRGQRILIPPEKRNHLPEDAGNTSGHGVVFLYNKGSVLCYFSPPLV